MDQRQIYPNITDLLYQQNITRLSSLSDGDVKYNNAYADNDNADRSSSPSIEDADSESAFGVDLSGKGTNLAGKSFTIAAILGLSNAEEDAMNLSVQERIHQNQRQLQNYLYSDDMQRLNDGYCRSIGVPHGLPQGKFIETSTFNLIILLML